MEDTTQGVIIASVFNRMRRLRRRVCPAWRTRHEFVNRRRSYLFWPCGADDVFFDDVVFFAMHSPLLFIVS